MPVFGKLQLWMDPLRRPGPETMAVDEWLLETAGCPVLRVYSWEGDWASIGYFGKVSEARDGFPGVPLVRRWTGGGMVDHRRDWTYTLVVPNGEPLASERGAASYRLIHEKLMQTIDREEFGVKLSDGSAVTGAARCFENPVGFDLIGQNGKKLAGAGQRRSKTGLLHQGSVMVAFRDPGSSLRRAEDFASRLAEAWVSFEMDPDPEDIKRRIESRYGNDEWMERR